jgi:hypothetical protein
VNGTRILPSDVHHGRRPDNGRCILTAICSNVRMIFVVFSYTNTADSFD